MVVKIECFITENIENYENDTKNKNELPTEQTNSQNWEEITIKLEDGFKFRDNENGNLQTSKYFDDEKIELHEKDGKGKNELSILQKNSLNSEKTTIKLEDEIEFQDDENDDLQPMERFDDENFDNRLDSNNDLSTECFDYEEIVNLFKCNECGERFFHRNTLTQHKTVHERFKPYECHECCKRYVFDKQLTRHQKTVHEGIKPFKCDVCAKYFSRKGNLDAHQRTIHEGIKPHNPIAVNLVAKKLTH